MDITIGQASQISHLLGNFNNWLEENKQYETGENYKLIEKEQKEIEDCIKVLS